MRFTGFRKRAGATRRPERMARRLPAPADVLQPIGICVRACGFFGFGRRVLHAASVIFLPASEMATDGNTPCRLMHLCNQGAP